MENNGKEKERIDKRINRKTEKFFVKSKEASQITGINEQTLRKNADKGLITSYKTFSGQRMYNKLSLENFTGQHRTSGNELEQRKSYVYCRVSSRNQLDDLERQCSSMRSMFPSHDLVKDCGSGLNWKRKGLRTILEHTMSGNVKEIVVAHKDRLCRFGFELIEFICNRNNTKLVVLDNLECKSREQELAEDLMAIVTVFSCRQHGRRKYRKQSSDTADKIISN